MQDELSKVKIIKCDIYCLWWCYDSIFKNRYQKRACHLYSAKFVHTYKIFESSSLCSLVCKKRKMFLKKRQDVTKDRIKKQVAESLKKLYKL